MTIIYKKWSRSFKRLLDFDGDGNCEQLHNNRKLYFVTIERVDYHDNEPYCFLEINNTFLLVGFLDGYQRTYMIYIFYEFEKGKIFLKKVQFWDYDGLTDEKTFSTEYIISRDGGVAIYKTDLKSRECETLTAKNPVDVSGNYDTYPEFGKYENLIRFERLSLK